MSRIIYYSFGRITQLKKNNNNFKYFEHNMADPSLESSQECSSLHKTCSVAIKKFTLFRFFLHF